MKTICSIGIHILIASVLFLPSLSFGQPAPTLTTVSTSSPKCTTLLAGDINNLKDVIDFAICLLIRSIIPLLLIIALMFFIWGIVQYFLNPNNMEERKKARQYLVWALIGMFVLFSISGIIQILRNTFGVTGNPIPLLPETQ